MALKTCYALLAILTVLPGCSSREAYNAGRAWQHAECNRMLEPERSACLARNNDDYDTYQKKRDGRY